MYKKLSYNKILKKIKNIDNKKVGAIFTLVLGIISFIIIYGVEVLDWSNDTWLLASERDLRAHYIGWKFFRKSSWNFPFGLMDNIVYPDKLSIIYTDSIPLLAIFFKLLNCILPSDFQYFGIWGCVCFMLQGYFAYKILSHKIDNIWICVIGAEFFILSPTMIFRLFYHTELAAHFLILWGIYVFIQNMYEKNVNKIGIRWSIVIFFVSCIHIYFIPIIGIIMLSSCICHIVFEYFFIFNFVF